MSIIKIFPLLSFAVCLNAMASEIETDFSKTKSYSSYPFPNNDFSYEDLQVLYHLKKYKFPIPKDAEENIEEPKKIIEEVREEN